LSQENVEIVRRGFAAFNEGDLETTASLFHADAEWRPYLGQLGGRVHRGRDAIVKMWSDINEHLVGLEMEPREFIDCGEAVVVMVEAKGIGTSSGAAVDDRWAQLYSLEDGLVRSVEAFSTRESALEAARRQE